jgi:hypothetical protein
VLREEGAAANRITRLAEATKGPHGAVVEDLAKGEVNEAQANAILNAPRHLPKDLDAETLDFSRTTLLEAARKLNARDLRELGRVLRNAADPDGAESEDEQVAKLRNAGFRIHGDGTETLTWRDSVENVAHAKALLARAGGAPARVRLARGRAPLVAADPGGR